MAADVVEPQRARVADQLAEHAVPARQRADAAALLVVDAERQEALEVLASLIQHAEGRVLRIRDVARHLEDALEHALDVQRRDHLAREVEHLPADGAGLVRPSIAIAARLPRVVRPHFGR